MFELRTQIHWYLWDIAPTQRIELGTLQEGQNLYESDCRVCGLYKYYELHIEGEPCWTKALSKPPLDISLPILLASQLPNIRAKYYSVNSTTGERTLAWEYNGCFTRIDSDFNKRVYLLVRTMSCGEKATFKSPQVITPPSGGGDLHPQADASEFQIELLDHASCERLRILTINDFIPGAVSDPPRPIADKCMIYWLTSTASQPTKVTSLAMCSMDFEVWNFQENLLFSTYSTGQPLIFTAGLGDIPAVLDRSIWLTTVDQLYQVDLPTETGSLCLGDLYQNWVTDFQDCNHPSIVNWDRAHLQWRPLAYGALASDKDPKSEAGSLKDEFDIIRSSINFQKDHPELLRDHQLSFRKIVVNGIRQLADFSDLTEIEKIGVYLRTRELGQLLEDQKSYLRAIITYCECRNMEKMISSHLIKNERTDLKGRVARCLSALKLYSPALSLLTVALESEPDNLELIRVACEVYEARGDETEARRYQEIYDRAVVAAAVSKELGTEELDEYDFEPDEDVAEAPTAAAIDHAREDEESETTKTMTGLDINIASVLDTELCKRFGINAVFLGQEVGGVREESLEDSEEYGDAEESQHDSFSEEEWVDAANW